MKLIEKVKRQTKLIIGIAAGLLIGGVGSVAVFAAIPDTNNVIHACYRSGFLGNGQVRIIDSPSQSCSNGETAISWHSTSPGNFKTNLNGADFSNADLRYRNFSGAQLHGATFVSTNLIGSDLHAADLSGATFSEPGETYIRNASFKNTNLNGATFLEGTVVNLTDFSGVSLNATIFKPQVSFNTDDFSNVDFRNIQAITGIGFSGVNFTNADFRDLTLNNVTIIGSNLTSTNFTNTHFAGSNLSGTDLTHAILTSASWLNTICPDLTNSDNNGNTCLGHLTP